MKIRMSYAPGSEGSFHTYISLRISVGKLFPTLGPPKEFLKYFSHFPHLSMATFKPRETQGTHTIHHVQNKMENAVSVHGACGGRMQPTCLQSNNPCLAVVDKSRRAKPSSSDFYV